MIKETIFAAVIAAAALCLTIPAAAEPQTYTTGDGVLSIDLPDENWKEMSDPGKWVSFSDGANLITLEHLSTTSSRGIRMAVPTQPTSRR